MGKACSTPAIRGSAGSIGKGRRWALISAGEWGVRCWHALAAPRQGPWLGFNLGGEAGRTMMLVYNRPAAEALFGEGLHTRFVGLNGSAYGVGGFGFTAAMYDEMIVVPIRTGVGARLGVNVGYLKFTPEPTWNPF